MFVYVFGGSFATINDRNVRRRCCEQTFNTNCIFGTTFWVWVGFCLEWFANPKILNTFCVACFVFYTKRFIFALLFAGRGFNFYVKISFLVL